MLGAPPDGRLRPHRLRQLRCHATGGRCRRIARRLVVGRRTGSSGDSPDVITDYLSLSNPDFLERILTYNTKIQIKAGAYRRVDISGQVSASYTTVTRETVSQ